MSHHPDDVEFSETEPIQCNTCGMINYVGLEEYHPRCGKCSARIPYPHDYV